MERLLPIAWLPVLLLGCEPNCPEPQTLNGQTFQVFANPLEELNSQQLEAFTDAPDFLSYGSPMNGHSAWRIDWGASESGPLTISIDEQSFEGRGEWDPIECGHFSMTWEGEYLADDATRHDFSASGVFVTYEGHLAGEMLWVQSWATGDGRAGSWRGRVGVVGER